MEKIIQYFLVEKLTLTLHPQKSKILSLDKGIPFLGFRVFYYHKLLQKKNIRKFERMFQKMEELYKNELLEREKVIEKFEGWIAFAQHAQTYKIRKRFAQKFNQSFPLEKTTALQHVPQQERFQIKIEETNLEFTQQKTLYLIRERYSIQEIAQKRQLKEGTVWEHIRKLVAQGNLSIYTILKKEGVEEIRKAFCSSEDSLKEVYERLGRKYSYDTIHCVQAHLEHFTKNMRAWTFFSWYQKKHCLRKCYKNKKQQQVCKMNMKLFTAKNLKLAMKKKEFLELFNKYLHICILPEEEKKRYITWEEFRTRSQQK